jgi:nitroreductase
MTTDLNMSDFRQPEHAIDPLILKRWSPRAFSGEALADEELLALFEAAKWAPSNFNNQSWRFIYAKNNTPQWPKLFALLNAGNQSWVNRAAVIVLVISKQTYDYNGLPFQTGSFDAGAAWENLALEAASRGLVAHGLGGFDYDRARTEFNIPAEYRVEAMLALGRPGNKEDLPVKLQAGEFPSDRKKLSQIISEGEFKF